MTACIISFNHFFLGGGLTDVLHAKLGQPRIVRVDFLVKTIEKNRSTFVVVVVQFIIII